MSEETKQAIPPNEKPVDNIPADDYHQFFSESLLDFEGWAIRLYRVEQNRTRLKKMYLRTYEGTIPREDEIGEEFGGGRFCAISQNPQGGKALTKDIYLDEKYWNAIHAEKQIEKVQAKKREMYEQTRERERDPLEQVERIARIFSMMNGTQNQQPAPVPNFPDFQTKAVESMFDTMLGGMKKMQTALIENKVDQITGKNAESPEPNFSLGKEIVEFIKENGMEFLKAGALKKNMIKNAVRSDENVKEAVADPALFQYIYDEVSKPDNMGPEKAEALFTGLGFTIPADEPEKQTI